MDNLTYHRQTQRITHIELGLILLSFLAFWGAAAYFEIVAIGMGTTVCVGLIYSWGHRKQRKLDALAEPRFTDDQMRAMGYNPPDTVIQCTDGRVVWEFPVQYAQQTKRWWRVKPQDTTKEPENVA
jgi:hypothetical protein